MIKLYGLKVSYFTGKLAGYLLRRYTQGAPDRALLLPHARAHAVIYLATWSSSAKAMMASDISIGKRPWPPAATTTYCRRLPSDPVAI